MNKAYGVSLVSTIHELYYMWCATRVRNGIGCDDFLSWWWYKGIMPRARWLEEP